MTRLLILIAAMAVFQDPSTRADELPRVRAARGSLLAWRAATAKVEAVKDTIQVGTTDRLGTESGDYVMLATDGDVMISLKGVKVGDNRGLSIERTNGRLLFRLHEGRAVLESFKSDILIETPHGQVDAKSAYFLIEVTETATRVVAIDGPLTFTTSQGKAVLESGQESLAEKDKKPSAPRPTVAEEKLREFTDQDSPYNLVQNPGFESRLEKWTSASMTAKAASPNSADYNQKHSGKVSLKVKIEPKTFSSNDTLLAAQRVNLKAGKRYLIRAYVRIESDPKHVQKLKAGLSVANPLETWRVVSKTEDREGGWHLLRGFFTPAKDSVDAGLQAAFDPETYEGTVWADDFFIGEIPEPSKPPK